MRTALVHTAATCEYDFGPSHPLAPIRVELAVELMRAYHLLKPTGPVEVIKPKRVSDADLALVHDAAYIAAVKSASRNPFEFVPTMGLGTSDNPVVGGLHRAASLICGAAAAAVDNVLDGSYLRTFAVAGGLHHAHRARAAGFCVYNDPAIAIARALRERPDLCVLYVDIDAHHGDGVQEAFWDDSRVTTISVHESGEYLYPGTGAVSETGGPDARGSCVDVPLPPLADEPCYDVVFDRVVLPLARAVRPDLIVAQLGCDSHHADPLTHLGLTVSAFGRLVERIVSVADDVCDGRLATLGGGGYGIYDAVPRCWTLALAALADVSLPEPLPETWRAHVRELTGQEAPTSLTHDVFSSSPERTALVRRTTEHVVEEVHALVFPPNGLRV